MRVALFLRALVLVAVGGVALLVVLASIAYMMCAVMLQWMKDEMMGNKTTIGQPDVPLDSWPSWTPAEVLEQERDGEVSAYPYFDGCCDECGKRLGASFWACPTCDLWLCEAHRSCPECDPDAGGVGTAGAATGTRMRER